MLIWVEPHFASINNRRKNLEVAVTVFLRIMQTRCCWWHGRLPIFGGEFETRSLLHNAEIAQLVEHFTSNEEVISSILIFSSMRE